MSVDYVEAFEIGSHTFGIENLAQLPPKERKFHARSDGRQFQLWHNGCGCGGAMNLPEAREALRRYAVDVLRTDRERAIRMLLASADPLARIEHDPRGLELFRVRRRKQQQKK